MSGPDADEGLSPTALRQAFATWPSGVTAVAALVDGQPVGLAASSFTSVSLDPPLVSVCVSGSSATWLALEQAQGIGVSVLGVDHGPACRALAGPADERFAGLGWRATPSGAVVLDDVPLALDCSVHTIVPAGDHLVLLLLVHDLTVDLDLEPLVFHGSRFRQLGDA